jgi:hypothetical protein
VHLAHPLEGDPSRRLHPHHSSELIALRNGLLWAAVPHALWSRPLRAALTLCRGLETLLGRRETSKGDFLRVACAHRAAKSLRSTHRTLQRGRLPGSQMAKVEVEKVGVSQVGGPRGPENKAKTLQKRRIRPPNLEQNRMRRGFSTGWGILRSWTSALRCSKKFATRSQRPSYGKDSYFRGCSGRNRRVCCLRYVAS